MTIILLGLLALGWIACAPLAAYLAHERGRGASEGLVLGLVYGPLGVVASGLLPDLSAPHAVVRRVPAAHEKAPPSR